MLETSDNHFGPSLENMLDAGVLSCAKDMRKRTLLLDDIRAHI